MSYLSTNIPTQLGYLDTSFLNDQLPRTSNKFIPVEIFSIVSIPKRCLLFNVMSEYGAQFARVPIHYLSNSEQPSTKYDLDWLQLWDSFSYYFTIQKFDYHYQDAYLNSELPETLRELTIDGKITEMRTFPANVKKITIRKPLFTTLPKISDSLL